jgi:hypothetical protein
MPDILLTVSYIHQLEACFDTIWHHITPEQWFFLFATVGIPSHKETSSPDNVADYWRYLEWTEKEADCFVLHKRDMGLFHVLHNTAIIIIIISSYWDCYHTNPMIYFNMYVRLLLCVFLVSVFFTYIRVHEGFVVLWVDCGSQKVSHHDWGK